ncbi:MAG: oxygen-insensitive NADPH nitroreductase [Alysiella sp.]|uniref:oxygen-insensitive NADPH nitroreductase n=1 Tax=Alysiella sp. TaxID=1872483 RepID=UPI0026DBA25A|nr:oxygen-insensitive NADPH nitroreductase [Alysiella sp.]MDO4433365.1 oxygen-insensitive NADPH nitroreductase [Alysiella sp.]
MLNSQPALETALAHRSIRKFTDQAIPENVLSAIIQAGQMASTSSYMQNVSIIRVTDKAKRAQIREVCANAYKGKLGHHYVENCAEFLVFCADAARHLHFAPNAQIDWTEVLLIGAVDAGITAQNVLLTAESLGLGGVYIGSLRNDLAQITEILALPYGVFPLFGMCLGYPDHEPGQRPRLPMNIVLSENTYQNANEVELHTYDEVVKAYYKERSNLDLSWGDQIRSNLCTEVRPHLLAFAQKQGFAKK